MEPAVNSGTKTMPNDSSVTSESREIEGNKDECEDDLSSDAETTTLSEFTADLLRWREEDIVWWQEKELDSFWRGYRRHDRTASALSNLAQEQYDRRISERNSRTSVAFYRLPLMVPSVFPSRYVKIRLS